VQECKIIIFCKERKDLKFTSGKNLERHSFLQGNLAIFKGVRLQNKAAAFTENI